jgi:hypothetical protein
MSPRLPRDVSGSELAKPNHNSLRTATLNGIIKDVAEHAGIARDMIVKQLFG